MPDGLLLQPDVVSRLYRMLRWYEASGHAPPRPAASDARLVPHELRRFELAAALTPGGSALAWLRRWDESADAYATSSDTALQFTVYDAFGTFRGRAKDAYSSPHDAGSRGLAWKPHDCQRWEIVDMTRHALLIRGSATTASGAGLAIDGISVLNPVGAIITTNDPAGSITLANPHGWDWDDDAIITAAWNETTHYYDVLEADCTAP